LPYRKIRLRRSHKSAHLHFQYEGRRQYAFGYAPFAPGPRPAAALQCLPQFAAPWLLQSLRQLLFLREMQPPQAHLGSAFLDQATEVTPTAESTPNSLAAAAVVAAAVVPNLSYVGVRQGAKCVYMGKERKKENKTKQQKSGWI